MQDFTKVGIQPQPIEGPDSLTRLVRDGVQAPSAREGFKLGIDKLTGAMPMGIDAPSKGMRKTIAGSWALLAVIKHGFLALLLIPFGALLIYLAFRDAFDGRMLGYGIGALAIGMWLARKSLRSARDLRSIARA